MGRNTWESLPRKPLPNRTNLIVTSAYIRNLPYDAWTVSGIDDISDDAWIIGGAKLINSSWHRIKEIHLSYVTKEYKCDTFIDIKYIEDNFTLMSSENNIDHQYQIWKRK
jgi:dihydrofolate reductase